MFEQVKISPSVLSADFMNMTDSIRTITEGGAAFIHVDVMDGHFVPNITMGIPLVKQLHTYSELPLDVHLMVSNPLDQIPWFLDAGADILTVHLEALDVDAGEVSDALRMIREGGARSALALKPDTPISLLKPFITEVDMVLVMSVYPGFSGQSYIEGTDERVAEVVSLAQEAGVSPLIEVDGGIDVSTAGLVSSKGADILVAGNAVFAQPDPGKAIAAISAAAEATRF